MIDFTKQEKEILNEFYTYDISFMEMKYQLGTICNEEKLDEILADLYMKGIITKNQFYLRENEY